MKAKPIKGKSPEEIKTALQESMAYGFKPTLAIVFLSISQDRNAVCKLLDDEGISIYGATSNGEFIDEKPEKGSITILLLEIDTSYFSIMFDEFKNGNFRSIAQTIAERSKELFDTPAFLVAGSNVHTDVEEVIGGFEDILGKEVNIFGGMAGDDYMFIDQFVFTNGKSSSQGIVALVLDESKILIKGIATHGWKAVGTEKTVTKSEGNHVFTVENIPVLELTKKYGGLDELTEENDKKQLELTATNFPLQLQKEKGAPIMRPGLIIDWEDGSFYCGGKVPQGSKVRFSLPPDFDVIEKVVDELQSLKNKEMPEADALVVFSCAGRLMTLGPLIDKEIEGIKNVWAVPIIGFFSNGEIARATDGNNDFHNLTTCSIALKEK